jgi:DNA-binding response OmpR family regulator
MSTVVVVDDDADLRKTIARVLASAGHEVLEAEDGEAGLEIIVRRRPDLVVTDVMMPKIDGVQMVTQVRAFFPDLPIIALSGSDTAWAAAQMFGRTGSSTISPLSQARRAGADITIGKPFEVQLLLDAVRKLLSRAVEGSAAARHHVGVSARADHAARKARDERKLYHVRIERGRWCVHREGTERAIVRAEDQEDAVFLARQIGAREAPALVVVYREDGTVLEKLEFS